MHITKRMLRSVATLGVALIGGTALAAGPANTSPYSQSFEDYGLWATNAAVTVTNGWYSGGADLSSITNMSYTFTDPIGTPIAGTHDRVLRLATEGTTLTNTFASVSFSPSSQLYVDTMVSFVVSEDLPTAVSNDVNVKAAVFVNSGSNLVVYCGGWDTNATDFAQTKFVTTTKSVVPGTWYRLTIALDAVAGLNPAQAFKVMVNGTPVWSAVAYTNDWKTTFASSDPTGGNWFFSAANRPSGGGAQFPTVVDGLAFQGTGFIDDLELSSADPFPAGANFNITQFIGANGSAGDPTSPIVVAQGNSTSIVYTANQYFRIAALTNDAAEVGAATDQASYTLPFNNVTANHAVEVYFKAATAAQVGLVGVPVSYAQTYYPTEAAALADTNIATDYLLGLDPTGTYAIGFAIDSIGVAGTTITVVTKLTDGVNPLTTTINGNLEVQGKTSLTNASWTVIGAATINGASFDASGLNTNVFTDATYQFYKAVITP